MTLSPAESYALHKSKGKYPK
ncbi:MAG: hypothetical protein RLY38_422, partial [Actinomycetota bacterium]